MAIDDAAGLTDQSKVWPVMSLDDATAMLCERGALFELETVEIDGIPTKCWKNQPPALPVLARRARQLFPDDTFLVYEGERVTYDGWCRAIAGLAIELGQLGIKKGDRVALAMRNLPEWPVTFFAVTALGAIVVPLNGWWTGAELEYGLAQSGASTLICDAERWVRIAPRLASLPELHHVFVARSADVPESPARSLDSVIGHVRDYGSLPDRDLPDVDIQPDDYATIFYTSGTTGFPKGALGTHRNNLNSALVAAFSGQRGMLRRGEEPRSDPKTSLVVIPMFHVTACHAIMMPTIYLGGTLVFIRKWDAAKALQLIERERVNITGGVPTIAWQLLEAPDRGKFDLSSLEAISYGGAPSSPDLVRRISGDLGVFASNGWGMTETSATVTVISAEDYRQRPDSCGPALPVSDLKIMSEDGTEELPAGKVGELWAFGPQVVKGYWDNPDATAETFRDGWVRTGDLARLDEDGFCYIVDRAKDMVIRGGENIYCIEVEAALYEHPGVIDAAVVGLSHPTLGQEPAAVVHLAKDTELSEQELQDWVAQRLAAFKIPVKILFADALLPRNANGKILKDQLRALFDEEVQGHDV